MEKDYIFVYGLFRDQSKELLGNAIHFGKSSIYGRLFRVNEFYPGYTKSDSGLVWGDVYLIDINSLPEMDEYEGHEYKRVRVITNSGLDCWVYEYKYETDVFNEIKNGDWFLR